MHWRDSSNSFTSYRGNLCSTLYISHVNIINKYIMQTVVVFNFAILFLSIEMVTNITIEIFFMMGNHKGLTINHLRGWGADFCGGTLFFLATLQP